jgi:hypothetical protein
MSRANESSSDDDSNTGLIISIVISCIILIIIIGGIGGYLWVMADNHLVKTDQVLESDTSYLILETNFPKGSERCVADKTYGVNADGRFYVKKGCSGIFLHRNEFDRDYIGVCTSSDLEEKICTFDYMIPVESPVKMKITTDSVNPVHTIEPQKPQMSSLAGLIRKKDQKITVMSQNGKCTPDSYGFYGNNKIFTKDGCDGIFRIGPLIGKCESSGTDPESPPTMTKCPIGYKEEINGRQMGLVLAELRSTDQTQACQMTPNTYGYRNMNTGFRDYNACNGDLVFRSNQQDNLLYANYKVECDDFESDCNLDSVTEV